MQVSYIYDDIYKRAHKLYPYNTLSCHFNFLGFTTNILSTYYTFIYYIL